MAIGAIKGGTKLGGGKKRGPGLKLMTDMKIPEKSKGKSAARKTV